jgi:hypothetical protein
VAIRYGTGATGGGKDFLAGYGVHSSALRFRSRSSQPDSWHQYGAGFTGSHVGAKGLDLAALIPLVGILEASRKLTYEHWTRGSSAGRRSLLSGH